MNFSTSTATRPRHPGALVLLKECQPGKETCLVSGRWNIESKAVTIEIGEFVEGENSGLRVEQVVCDRSPAAQVSPECNWQTFHRTT